MTREFQPVYEIAKSIGSQLNLNIDFTNLKKFKSTSQLKEINDPAVRKNVLKDAFMLEKIYIMVNVC
jgi:predicted amidophosphoribosyltransferase